jgi:DNA topoisomerase-1
MEDTLDDIASGAVAWLPYLQEFYLGEAGLENQVKVREEQIDPSTARSVRLEGLDAEIRIGQYGPYIQIESESGDVRASLPADVLPADLDSEQVQRLIRLKLEGPEAVGEFPDTGEPMYLLDGPYGPYIQLGEASEEKPKPKRVTLPKGMNAADVTPAIAEGLLRLPRTLGNHPESGKKIQAGIGRFGPYIVCDGDFRSLKKEDNILSIDLERALELLAQPKRGRGGSTAKPLRELGNHPTDGEPIGVYDGRYGPYVKHGKTNASLPKDVGVDDVTLDQAVELLAARSGKKRGSRTAKAATAKTGGAKKSGTKASGAKSGKKAVATAKSRSRNRSQSS